MDVRFLKKTNIRDLAIWGEAPAFNEKRHVGRPNIGDRRRLLARINDMLDRRWLSNDGRYVQELERRIADLVGVKHCVATCNATIAQEITARALELRGEVIVPSFTFIATPHALQWLQIKPVFCDVDPHTHNLDPRCLEKLITPLTTAIIGVHLWGRACAIDDLEAIARIHGLKLVFDAAHALGCSHKERGHRSGRTDGGVACGKYTGAAIFLSGLPSDGTVSYSLCVREDGVAGNGKIDRPCADVTHRNGGYGERYRNHMSDHPPGSTEWKGDNGTVANKGIRSRRSHTDLLGRVH